MGNGLDQLNNRLKEVSEKFDALKKMGFNEEVLVIYLADKCSMPKKKVRDMLFHTDKFFKELVSRETEKAL